MTTAIKLKRAVLDAHDKITITAPVVLALRLCLSCGARFPDRAQLRSHLSEKLPQASRGRAQLRPHA